MKRFVLVFLFPCFLCFLLSICSLVEGRINTSSSPLSVLQNNTMRNLTTILSHQPSFKPNSNPNPCSWTSWVNCSVSSSSSASSQVIGINLSEYGLSTEATKNTSFFSLLCQIDSLQHLNLSHNKFESLPDSFLSNCSKLSQLRDLDISFNQLSGRLPNLSQFTGLLSLDLSRNNLSGKIDRQLHGLVLLKSLNLSYNSLTGNLPVNLSSALEKLLLSYNKFEGSIPGEMFKYANLTFLDLSQNQLNGSIPDGIEKLLNLDKLILSGNNLSGQLPSSMSMIKTLSWFAANRNNFYGSIPSGITTNLRFLDLSYNNLTGVLPDDLLSHGTLEYLDLTANSLEGHIPHFSGEFLTGLNRLRLGQNKLNGSIPAAIGELSGLMYLELNDNQFEGGIPVQLQKCKNLSLLNLAGNKLHGVLPKELGSIGELKVLKLQMNNLNGSIPDDIYQLANLITLNLSQNAFTGGISPLISSLKNISFLYLNDNKLEGQLPDSIGNIGLYLIELQLANNKFSGSIPQMIKNGQLTFLNLSSNLLMGPLPEFLSELLNLEVLDLSDNKFTGAIPSSFTKMSSLTKLDLSNNQLSGILPQFNRWVCVIITGNNIQNVTIPNTATPSQPRRRTNVLVVVIAVAGSVVVLGLLAALLFFVVSQRFNRIEEEDPLFRDNPSHVINGCFITSNSTHRSNINFMKAMVAVSNPENVVLKTRFATYYKAIMAGGSSYTVKKLNWGDKMFQMAGSHEKFEEELLVLGKLSNSNVMVPLAYALTQDNAYLFYESVHKGTVFDFLHKGLETALDWSSRYSIALGVAQGLTFLHGCTQPVVLLDLSTKSIHLKSLKEPQIGDIELCKVIDSFKSFGSLSAIAGSVGYMPPEYAYTMRVTMAGNVYSFGVILLELLTGKPPVSKGIELAKWAVSYSARMKGKEQILDSSIKRTSPEVHSQMLSVLKVALSCVCASPESRPKMRNVLRMLFNAR